MQKFRFSLARDVLSKVVASLIFWSGVLRWVNRFGNCFKARTTEKDALVFPYAVKRRYRSIQILVYHRVNDDRDPFFFGTPKDVFAGQMKYLKSTCKILPLDDAVARLRENDIPENAVVVTFDDGYRDNYTHAFPILKRLEIPATIFLATDAIGSARVLWHDRVFSAFRNSTVTTLKGFGGGDKEYSLGGIPERLSAQRQVLQFLWSLDSESRMLWINRLIERLEVKDREEVPGLMMSWEDAKVMHRGGISFGSHTASHPALSRLSADQSRVEILKSKKVIEERLNIPVRSFAYPRGKSEDVSERIKDQLKEAGYVCALTTLFGTNDARRDLFELKRGGPWEEYIPLFAMKLSWQKFCY